MLCRRDSRIPPSSTTSTATTLLNRSTREPLPSSTPRVGEPKSSLRQALPSLQGFILLPSYYCTSGLSLQGSSLLGVCINLADELDLPHLDDEDAMLDCSLHVTDQEERRRAWWII